MSRCTHKLYLGAVNVRENQIIVPPVLIKVCKLCVGRARYRIIAPEIISGRISVAQEHICALGLDEVLQKHNISINVPKETYCALQAQKVHLWVFRGGGCNLGA